MQIYFFNGGVQSEELDTLCAQLATALPDLKVIANLGDSAVSAAATRHGQDLVYIIFPIVKASLPLDRVISVAEQDHPGTFFIFISREISASEYKRLTRNGGADWVAWNRAAEEIVELLARRSAPPTAAEAAPQRELFIAAFVPSAGGVGNTTLALESAVQLKTAKQTRHLRVCLLDLNLQTGNVSDYLDIEARLKIDEIAKDPDRLDDQLFELFVGAHQSGVHVLAAPRQRSVETLISIAPLDALFRIIAKRYDVLFVDLPAFWFEWTPEIVSVCNVVLVTGRNTVPGLRQVCDTLQAVRSVEVPPKQIAVALGRCQTALLGRISRRHHVKRILPEETIFYIREDRTAAAEALNMGVPLAMSAPSGGLSKDVGTVTNVIAAAVGASKPKDRKDKAAGVN